MMVPTARGWLAAHPVILVATGIQSPFGAPARLSQRRNSRFEQAAPLPYPLPLEYYWNIGACHKDKMGSGFSLRRGRRERGAVG